MEVFDRLSHREHEQLMFWNEPRIGYKGIIAIHSTTLGPALGGTRFWAGTSPQRTWGPLPPTWTSSTWRRTMWSD